MSAAGIAALRAAVDVVYEAAKRESANSQQVTKNGKPKTAATGFLIAESEMQICGEILARIASPGTWLFLNGDLGAGKTTLTRQIVRALGGPHSVTSPTFSIMNVISLAADLRLLHLDLYRIKSWQELLYLGLEQEMDPASTCAVVEWAELLTTEEWGEVALRLGLALSPRVVTLCAEGDGRSLTLN